MAKTRMPVLTVALAFSGVVILFHPSGAGKMLSSPGGDPVELKPASTPWDARNPAPAIMKVK